MHGLPDLSVGLLHDLPVPLHNHGQKAAATAAGAVRFPQLHALYRAGRPQRAGPARWQGAGRVSPAAACADRLLDPVDRAEGSPGSGDSGTLTA